jgi:hypothetical protein
VSSEDLWPIMPVLCNGYRNFSQQCYNPSIMSLHEIANWTALYLATFICSAITLTLTSIAWMHFVAITAPWRELATWHGRLLFLPKLWWKWQKLYLSGTPVILMIVVYFAATMAW